MTFGEKLKDARRSAGLTQEQLAEKLSVSRQAVTKWESDKGTPDIENIKAIAKLFNISIDSLLRDDPDRITVIREEYDLSLYGKGLKKTRKDRAMRERFPDAKIFTLLGKLKLRKSEKVIDFMIGFFTDAPFGTPELINSFKNLDKEFYLLEKSDRQWLVMVTDEYIERRELEERYTEKRFSVGEWEFTNCGPIGK